MVGSNQKTVDMVQKEIFVTLPLQIINTPK